MDVASSVYREAEKKRDLRRLDRLRRTRKRGLYERGFMHHRARDLYADSLLALQDFRLALGTPGSRPKGLIPRVYRVPKGLDLTADEALALEDLEDGTELEAVADNMSESESDGDPLEGVEADIDDLVPADDADPAPLDAVPVPTHHVELIDMNSDEFDDEEDEDEEVENEKENLEMSDCALPINIVDQAFVPSLDFTGNECPQSSEFEWPGYSPIGDTLYSFVPETTPQDWCRGHSGDLVPSQGFSAVNEMEVQTSALWHDQTVHVGGSHCTSTSDNEGVDASAHTSPNTFGYDSDFASTFLRLIGVDQPVLPNGQLHPNVAAALYAIVQSAPVMGQLGQPLGVC
ncbi:hypothetical protein HDU93_005024 [Gonapodya sp. JEL0774]|nr:hypothetical protein HDU93_005024 [Gonapodya sp. JEL0774]